MPEGRAQPEMYIVIAHGQTLHQGRGKPGPEGLVYAAEKGVQQLQEQARVAFWECCGTPSSL